jgi:hypothetical protein
LGDCAQFWLVFRNRGSASVVVDGMSEAEVRLHESGFGVGEPGIGHGEPVAPDASDRKRSAEWCSLGLMKMFCPSCFLMGLIVLPIEAFIRGGIRLIRDR